MTEAQPQPLAQSFGVGRMSAANRIDDADHHVVGRGAVESARVDLNDPESAIGLRRAKLAAPGGSHALQSVGEAGAVTGLQSLLRGRRDKMIVVASEAKQRIAAALRSFARSSCRSP